MDSEIYRFRKWTNYLFWYRNRCFEIKGRWLHYYWDSDDIGIIVRGSMNLNTATARRVDAKTLHLSCRNITYYLKSDSEKDMSSFVSRLRELDVSITDN